MTMIAIFFLWLLLTCIIVLVFVLWKFLVVKEFWCMGESKEIRRILALINSAVIIVQIRIIIEASMMMTKNFIDNH